MRQALLGPVLLALALRLALVLATDRVAGDVERYQRVGTHLLDVSPNPYETKRLYPYPPPWAVVEAGSEWLARRGIGSFAVNVKLPVLAADLLMVAVLFAAARAGRASPLAPWLYALHPVSLLVGSAHGQFDAIPLVFLLLAVEALARGRRDASALALAAGIATKSFPILALPFLALGRAGVLARGRPLRGARSRPRRSAPAALRDRRPGRPAPRAPRLRRHRRLRLDRRLARRRVGRDGCLAAQRGPLLAGGLLPLEGRSSSPRGRSWRWRS